MPGPGPAGPTRSARERLHAGQGIKVAVHALLLCQHSIGLLHLRQSEPPSQLHFFATFTTHSQHQRDGTTKRAATATLRGALACLASSTHGLAPSLTVPLDTFTLVSIVFVI